MDASRWVGGSGGIPVNATVDAVSASATK
jgi:hypothetical protein